MNKPLYVLKFGGTSVGTVERIQSVAKRIIAEKESGANVIAVVSAMSGETNRLMNLAQEIDDVPNARELDVLLSAGEQVSMSLLSIAINKLGFDSVSLTGSQAQILTDGRHNDAAIKHINPEPIKQLLKEEKIVIVAGFQGRCEQGDITTLGRGGSDTTAVALAGALQADECQIFTDVDGVFTCDPRVIKGARKLDRIDFPNMEEMARKGAKILHLPSVQFAWAQNVPLRVRSSFSDDQGTLVKGEHCEYGVCGIALQRSLILVQVADSDLNAVKKQCQLLGISVWNVIQETDQSGVVIHQEGYAKLSLVFVEKIRNSEAVSALTIVGSKAKGMLQQSCELFAQHDIEILSRVAERNYLMFVLRPELLEKTANLIHEKQINLKEELEEQRKVAIS
ncbi:aspartate kinase [Vibrio algarum]|uniref:Aspartokinase n=1 Tax=Vibrio algarum TaxID=3020714 RepID=A0ABT4YNA6_9VIBR|nr:aspartate kinase [Vibrio sp. KJ40-1]MDB1123011.1 aspartate kinase [Vibrio sp. KJ40-1]